MEKLAVGIDIGGTNTKIGFVTSQGMVVLHKVVSTFTSGAFDDFVKHLAGAINNMSMQLGSDFEIVGIGIGAPSANAFSGTVEHASNLVWKEVIPVVECFKTYFPHIPISITNDAKAAAIGEMIYGGAKGMLDFMVVTLGTGVGFGIVAGGELVYGHDSFAGEVGHITVQPEGRDCGCGRKGCLETYASAGGVVRTAFELMARRRDNSQLRRYSFEDLTSEIIYNAAMEGDKLALEVFEYTGKMLGFTFANICTVTSPKVIFLSGGLSKSGELILGPARRYMDDNILINYRGKVIVRLSELEGQYTAVLGASAFVWR